MGVTWEEEEHRGNLNSHVRGETERGLQGQLRRAKDTWTYRVLSSLGCLSIRSPSSAASANVCIFNCSSFSSSS